MKRIIKNLPCGQYFSCNLFIVGILTTFWGSGKCVIYLHFIQSQFIGGNTLVVHLCMEVKKHQYGLYGFI